MAKTLTQFWQIIKTFGVAGADIRHTRGEIQHANRVMETQTTAALRTMGTGVFLIPGSSSFAPSIGVGLNINIAVGLSLASHSATGPCFFYLDEIAVAAVPASVSQNLFAVIDIDPPDYDSRETGRPRFVASAAATLDGGIKICSFTTSSSAVTAITDMRSFVSSGGSSGFLSITTALRNAIASPATGLHIYNTDTQLVEFWNGLAWISASAFVVESGLSVNSASEAWTSSGITLAADDVLILNGTGTFAQTGNPAIGPGGTAGIINGLAAYSLVGVIDSAPVGAESGAFFVGTSKVITGQIGKLSFRINDVAGGFGDNVGSFGVTMKLYRAVSVASDVRPGVTALSVAPASADSPIAVGDNDSRLPDEPFAAAVETVLDNLGISSTALMGALRYQTTWNATTNTPAIPAAASGNQGYYYRVATAGSTSISGITDWGVGDWLVSNGSSWDKIDNSEITNDDTTTTAQDPTNSSTVSSLRTVLTNIYAVLTGKQPLDSDLTSIAALSTTSFGRGLLELANAAALRTAAVLGDSATKNVGITAGTVAAGDDSRFGIVDIPLWVAGKPTASEQLLLIPMNRAVRFPQNLTGSNLRAFTAANLSATLVIKRVTSAGVSTTIATLTWAAGGTIPTVSGSITSAVFDFAATDLLEIDAQAVPDTTLAKISLNIAGVLI